MRRGLALAGALLALAIAPGPARAGDAARDGLRRLQSHEQRMRLEDLGIGARRRLEADRLRGVGDPAALERTRRRWRAEDRQRDFRRDRETEAIGSSVDSRERIERAAERLPEPSRASPAESAESRAAFEAERADLERRQRIERLRRDTAPLSGPGARRWPQ